MSACKKIESLIANWESVRVEALRAEVARLTACLRYEHHRAECVVTHGPGCELWGPAHYECAVRELASSREREAMMRGDERALPQRDRGPARAFVRQWVDSRRLIAEFFLPLVVLVLIFTLIPNEMLRFYASISWYAILLVVIVDLTVTGLRLSRALKAQFPDKADRKGAVFYGIMRAMQIRRLRVPLPQVKAGGAPVPPKKPRTR